ncbi:Holliday junction resolvase RuvX [Hoyosella altamirensis]|uniref:Putative pre-16S rRNA nuclease n=1 Tax=Hoyosella altamirensis TaxID=616997 RepID=A0A839RUE8_9ACTN|nr:Holliday junction resolvase RuvX [Hoyosella altamirensis]MBB3039937.1 putative Holliday junction resolvase [Hoyosella altamirensis]
MAGPQGVAPDRPGPDDPGRGRRIGIDVGSVRIGVAVSDPDGILASPVETVTRNTREVSDSRELDHIAAIIEEYSAVEVVVGLPRTLRGEQGHAADAALTFAEQLRGRIQPIPIRLSDERMTTVTAQRDLRAAGRKAKQQRAIIDQAAAVAILQGWLDERARYRPTMEDRE